MIIDLIGGLLIAGIAFALIIAVCVGIGKLAGAASRSHEK